MFLYFINLTSAIKSNSKVSHSLIWGGGDICFKAEEHFRILWFSLGIIG